MKMPRDFVIVEFIDFSSAYWEVIRIGRSLGAVIRRLQEVLAITESDPGFRVYGLTAEVTRKTLSLTFDCGDFAAAERFATFSAMGLGWRSRDGVLIGRLNGRTTKGG
jgi:hypothetical protein